MDSSSPHTKIVIVTGISGAGKSIVLKTLEDLGFFCVDNVPNALVHFFITQSTFPVKKVALGIDIRGGMLHEAIQYLVKIRSNKAPSIKIIFLTATLEILIKRFQETRRQHPLGGAAALSDALEQEKQLVLPLQEIADYVIDTDQLNIHQLRALVRQMFSAETPHMVVTLTSFGFKYGVPAENNFVFDVRSLPNPYFIPALKLHDGTNESVQKYLLSHHEVRDYWEKLSDFIIFSLNNAYREGRFFVQIAIGCTGGRHRSVMFVEKLAQLSVPHVQFFIKHRDIKKDFET